jgi:hypothetical protein
MMSFLGKIISQHIRFIENMMFIFKEIYKMKYEIYKGKMRIVNHHQITKKLESMKPIVHNYNFDIEAYIYLS